MTPLKQTPTDEQLLQMGLRDKIKWVVENTDYPQGWNAFDMLQQLRDLGWANEWVDVIGIAEEAEALGYRGYTVVELLVVVAAGAAILAGTSFLVLIGMAAWKYVNGGC